MVLFAEALLTGIEHFTAAAFFKTVSNCLLDYKIFQCSYEVEPLWIAKLPLHEVVFMLQCFQRLSILSVNNAYFLCM